MRIDNALLAKTDGGLSRTNGGLYSESRDVIDCSLFGKFIGSALEALVIEDSSVFLTLRIFPCMNVYLLGLGTGSRGDSVIEGLCTCLGKYAEFS